MQDVGEVGSFDIGHRDKKLVVLLTEVKNMDYVLVVQLFHRLGFQVETLDCFFIGGGIQNLECDNSIQSFVHRLVNIAHSAFAEGSDEVIVFVEGAWKNFLFLRCNHFAFLE